MQDLGKIEEYNTGYYNLDRCYWCSGCGQAGNGFEYDEPGWNVQLKNGRVTGFWCPDCQTAEMNAEAVINEATTKYAVNDDGLVVGKANAS